MKEMAEKVYAPQISVIVPVYKVEAYLHRCVDSILAQTFQDFEVLLVDDGSPDRSGEICDEYAKKDKRVRVFHKENGGVSSARNLGIENAKGIWIMFVDADDWLSADLVSYCSLFFPKADMIRFSYVSIFSEDEKEQSVYHLKNFQSKDELVSLIIEQKTYVAVWGGIYKRELFSTDLRFDCALSIGEDWLMYLALVNRSTSIQFLDIPFYKYNRYNEDSCISTASIKKRCNVFLALEAIKRYIVVEHFVPHLRNYKLLLAYDILAASFYARRYKEALRVIFHSVPINYSEILISSIPLKRKIFMLYSYSCYQLGLCLRLL